MRFKKVHDLNHMLSLDLFLASANAATLEKALPYLKANPTGKHPLLSADAIRFATESRLQKQNRQKDLEQLLQMQALHHWETDLETLLKQPYDALVVTNQKYVIDWVSDGFGAMTGYNCKFMAGKTARMLQGPETTEEIRQKISKQLRAQIPFTETLVNYRKNRQAYDCEIQIVPLFNPERLLTHFLALETEVKWISPQTNQTVPQG